MGVQYPAAHQLVKIRDRPRLRIHLWVLERENDLQCVMVNPLPSLCLVHGLAEWKTLPGEKLLAVVTARIDDERVSLPFANRVAHVIGFQIVGKISSVRPNFAPIVIILKVLQKPVAGLNILKWSGRKEIARCAVRITIQDSSGVNELFVDLVLRLPRRRERRQGIRVAAQIKRIDFAFGLHAGRGIPNAGKVMRVEGFRLSTGLSRSGLLHGLSKRYCRENKNCRPRGDRTYDAISHFEAPFAAQVSAFSLVAIFRAARSEIKARFVKASFQ